MLVTVKDCGHGPVGGCCSKLWVGVTYNQTGKFFLKFVLQDLIFTDSGTTEIMMVQGGRCVLCSEVGAGTVTAQDTWEQPRRKFTFSTPGILRGHTRKSKKNLGDKKSGRVGLFLG